MGDLIFTKSLPKEPPLKEVPFVEVRTCATEKCFELIIVSCMHRLKSELHFQCPIPRSSCSALPPIHVERPEQTSSGTPNPRLTSPSR